jgi:Putative auto-transporter adhesin, head GIN domain
MCHFYSSFIQTKLKSETMKTKALQFSILACITIFSFMSICASASSVQDVKKENRKVNDFSEIGLSISADLYLSQGSNTEVIIEADEDVLEKIITEVRGNELVIKFEKWYNHRGTGKIKVYVTTKNINKLVISGSGDIIAKTAIKTERMGFVISGSGSVLIDDLTVKDIHAIISGSGDIRVGGKTTANELDVTVTGSGGFDSRGLEFKEGDFVITGSGSIKAFVSEELEANITGSGRILYKGKPIIDANITGSGRIRSDD